MTDKFCLRQLARRVFLFTLLVSWCAFMLLGRCIFSHSLEYCFLVWNLFLAALPVFMATGLVWSYSRQQGLVVQASFFALWLVFLPNAPYLVTDFVHLRPHSSVPLWFDIALLASFAGTGLIFGYASLADVQSVVARKFSTATGWVVAVGVLLLSGFGIYLGRFLRWNSWDALANPLGLFINIAERTFTPFSHPRAAAVTFIYGMALSLGYLSLRLLEPLSAFSPKQLPDDGTRKP